MATETSGRRGLQLIQLGSVAFRINLRVLLLSALAGLALLAMAVWGLTLGSFRLSLAEILQALRGAGSQDADFIILDLRLPRVLVAILVGPMLAMAGALFQGLVRNPLVSPDILGINAGATLAAVFWIVTRQPHGLLPLAAFVGALGAAAMIYLLTWRGRITGPRLILVGIGINALLTAGTTWLIIRYPVNQVTAAVLWTAGTVSAATGVTWCCWRWRWRCWHRSPSG